MKRLILDIDELKVESFDVDDGTGDEGTVFGQQQWTDYCTANGHYPCNEPTYWKLDANCADSVYPGEGNCTQVCASAPLVCDTSDCRDR